MVNKTVNFTYSVGSETFDCKLEVDEAIWNDALPSERIDMLHDEAMLDVEEILNVEEDSIDDE